jgi:hypothetical protein
MTNWLAGWERRKSHLITASAGAGTNYQKKITVHYGSPPSIGQIAKLTLLNQRTALAFTVPANTNWTTYNFGDTVPSNTIVALCMLKGNGSSDINFRRVGDTSGTCWSFGASNNSFDGAIFALIPVESQQTQSWNLGSVCAVDVYVVGYFTEETEGDFYFEMFNQDNQVITNGTATAWTDVDISSLKVVDSGLQIKGAYIVLDCATDQDVYFRAGGSAENGVLWEPDIAYPGPHLMGFIPVNSSGIFQYKTSSGNAINVYVEGLIHQASASISDRVRIYGSYNEESFASSNDSAWHTITPTNDAKVFCVSAYRSPGQMNTCKVRPTGGTNNQISYYKPSCGQFTLLVAKGTGGSFDYWNNADAASTWFVGGISIHSSSDNDENVYLNSHCRADFGDIRFTGDDGTTLLDYWQDLDLLVSGTSSVFWVEVADTLESNATIYIYYDKPDATSVSNGDNTFLLFDHFDDASLDPSKWTAIQKGGGVTSEPSGTAVLLHVHPAVSSDNAGIRSIATFTNSVAFIVKRKQASENRFYMGMSLGSGITFDDTQPSQLTVKSGYWWRFYTSGHDTSEIYENDGATPPVTTNVTTTGNVAWTTCATYAIWEARYDQNGVLEWRIDGILKTSGTDTTYLNTEKTFMINQGSYIGGAYGVDTYVDYVIVRKFIATEPAHSTWGNEGTKPSMVIGKLFIIDKSNNLFRVDISEMSEEKALSIS